MNTDDIEIALAHPDDAQRLLEIYAPYVTDTAITFEYTVPGVEEFRERILTVLSRYPYLVARSRADHGKIIGYAYASPFHIRAAYQWAVETSIYVDMACRGKGVGRRLHDMLESLLAEQNILNLNACIARPVHPDEYLDEQSVCFHRHMGYRLVGEFQQCGYKFNRWYNMVWMEKHIGPHTQNPAVPKRLKDIRKL